MRTIFMGEFFGFRVSSPKTEPCWRCLWSKTESD